MSDHNSDIASWLNHPFTKKIIKSCNKDLEQALVLNSSSSASEYNSGYQAANNRQLYLITHPYVWNEFLNHNEENNES